MGLHAELADDLQSTRGVARVEDGMRIAAAGEEALEAGKIGRARVPHKHRSGAPGLDQADPAEDEGAHDRLADFGRTDHHGAQVSGVEWHCNAAFRARVPGGERRAPAELAHFAAELTGPVDNDRRLMPQPIPADDGDRPSKDEPGGRITVTDFENHLARCEGAALGAREASRCRDLGGVECREHLVAARVEQAHVTPHGLFMARCRRCRDTMAGVNLRDLKRCLPRGCA